MVAGNTALYILALLSVHPAFSVGLVRIESGISPRLPRSSAGGLTRRSGRVPEVQRGAAELPLGITRSRGTGEQLVGRDDPAQDSVRSGRQELGQISGTYTIPVIIGTPPNAYPLQLDLASSDILLASTLCTDSSCPASRGDNVNPYYGFTSSSTLANVTDANLDRVTWSTRYADGSTASGYAAKETVEIAGVAAQDVPFGVINATNITLSEQRISGILGLAFPRLSTLARASLQAGSAAEGSSSSESSSPAPSASSTLSAYLPPLLERLTTQPYLQYPIFALALNETHPSLTLGGVSTNYTSPSNATDGRRVEDIEWLQVVPFGPAVDVQKAQSLAPTHFSSSSSASSLSVHETASASSLHARHAKRAADPSTLSELEDEAYLYWAVQLRNISMNGTNVELNATYADLGLGSIALLDVGTNGIYGPIQDVINIFSTVRDSRQVAEGQWAVPCDTEMTMGFSFGGQYITLQPSEWISGIVINTQMCLAWPVALPESGDGLDWQLGTPFLKKVYSVFSYGINGVQAPLVGFLPLLSDSQPGTSSSASASSSQSASASSIDPNSPIPTSVENASQILSHITTTIATQLPNVLLPDPTYTTPAYLFSSAPIIAAGIIQSVGLANASAYTVMPLPTVATPSHNISVTSTRSIGGVGNSMESAPPGSGSVTRSALSDYRAVTLLTIALALHANLF